MSKSKVDKSKVKIYTKAEATALVKEIKTFIDKIAKRDGKVFDFSVGMSVVCFASKDGKYPPFGHLSYGNGNELTLEFCAAESIKSIAKKNNTSVMPVITDVGIRAITGM